MSSWNCAAFRGELERLLAGGSGGQQLVELSWHEHLLACESCRELLEAEEALEHLLASLPRPELPEELARRVLARLAAARRTAGGGGELDRLLDLDRAPEAPEHLGQEVLAGLAGTRQRLAENRRLTRLLDRLPEPQTSAGLSERVLAALGPARRPAPLRPVHRTSLAWAAAAAAVLLLAWGAWRLWPAPSGEPRAPDQLVEGGPGQPDPPHAPTGLPDDELLANLDLLVDDWEILMGEEVEPLLATLGVEDELWLAAGTAEDEPSAEDSDG